MATNYTARPHKNENMERFIKRFTKKCKKLGIMQEMRDKQEFVSKSEKKRLAKKKAIARKNKKK